VYIYTYKVKLKLYMVLLHKSYYTIDLLEIYRLKKIALPILSLNTYLINSILLLPLRTLSAIVTPQVLSTCEVWGVKAGV